ncbi:MAG: SAM-dependent methyltransferase, partial [Actinobacteria bacterium]|nr:SAM-dependent methyltransferase [Actinomycetota bacterium]
MALSRSWFVVVEQALQPASPSPPCPARPDERLPNPTCLFAEPLARHYTGVTMSEVPTATHPDKNHESPGTIHPVYHGVLYGVGVGPGSPDLVTLRAVDILKGVQHVIAPTIDEQLPGRA